MLVDSAPAAAATNTVTVTSMSVLPSRPTFNGVRYVTANPKLTVTLTKELGGIIKPYVNLEIWEVGGTSAVWTVGSTELSRHVADGVLVDGKNYRWRARGRDANFPAEPYGAWSAWNNFTADTIAPVPPTISSTAYPVNQTISGGGPGQFVFTTTTTNKDAKGVCYKLDGLSQQCATGTALADGRRTLTVTLDPAEGWHALAAWSEDYAGNTGDPSFYEFGRSTTNEKVLGPDYATFPGEPIGSPAPTPDPTGDSNAPPTVGGTITLPNGSPAVGYTVRVYPVGEGELAPIAQATTGSDGSWSVTMTNLSSTLKAEAAANDGVLNVEAVAFGKQVGGNREFAGVMSLQTGVAANGILTTAAASARLTPRFPAPLIPILADSERPTPPTAAEYNNSFAEQEVRYPTSYSGEDTPWVNYAFLPATSPSRTPVSPFTVGSTNYQNVLVAPVSGSTFAAGRALAASCSAYQTRTTVLSTTYRWTTVGEQHAAWDVKGKVTYSSTANTDVSAGISYNSGSLWGASGTTHLGNSWGYSVSHGPKGPYYAKEMDIPVQWKRYRVDYCNQYNQWAYAYDSVKAIKVYVPNGWYVSTIGADLLHMDGYTKWKAAPYKYKLQPGSGYGQTSGKTRGFGAAASLFGFGATATTNRSTSRQQDLDVGTSTRYTHDIFMYQCKTCNPRGFYSY